MLIETGDIPADVAVNLTVPDEVPDLIITMHLPRHAFRWGSW